MGGQNYPLLIFSLAALLSGLSRWCSGCPFTRSRSAPQPRAAASTLPGSLPHTVPLLHAHADADGRPQFTHTPLLTLPFPCAHMQIQGGLKQLSFVTSALFLEKAQWSLPSLAHPWCAHLVADKDGNGDASLWAPA